MKCRSLIALIVCAALASPAAAQTRVAAAIVRAPAGLGVSPLGAPYAPTAPFHGVGLAAPALFAGAQTPVLAVPALPKPAVPVELQHAAVSAPASGDGILPEPTELRAEGESFWSGSDAKGDITGPIPAAGPAAVSASPSRSRTLSSHGLVVAPAFISAVPALPQWVSDAAPYVGGAAALGGAFVLNRVSHWAIDKLAPRFGWDAGNVVMARFISSVSLWTAGVGIGLTLAGAPSLAVLLPVGAGATITGITVTLAIRDVVTDVAGNLFRGLTFLLSRPFAVGSKVTIDGTTGVVHDLTLRYLVVKNDAGGFAFYTHNVIAALPIKLYGTYQIKGLRFLHFGKPALPHGLFRALRDAVTPTLWRPALFSALAVAALFFFPMLPPLLKGAELSWLAALMPYAKAGVVAFLASSLARSLKAVLERLAARYGWTRSTTTAAKFVGSLLTWVIGGSFLLGAVGLSWAWLAGAIGFSAVLTSILAGTYVSAIVIAFIFLRQRMFRIGEHVRIGKNEGTVTDITLQNVVLKLDDESYMLIPHSVANGTGIHTQSDYGQQRK